MKKLAILVGAIALTSSTFAQNDTWGSDKKKDKSKDKSGTMSNSSSLATNKKGKILNPEAGDWSIGVDATPFIDFAADLFHIGAAGSKPAPTFLGMNDTIPTYSISGKYFKRNDLAYRGTIRFNFNNEDTTAGLTYISDFTTPDPSNWPNTVEDTEEKDKMKKRDWSVGLAGGLEWRKGSKRLQGYYGGEVVIALAGSSTKYKYGYDLSAMDADPLTDDALSAYTTDFGSNVTLMAGDHDERVLSVKDGMTIAAGVRGFVGVEFFFAPKMSIGGEFGWGLGIAHQGRGKTKTQGIDFRADDGTVLDGEVVSDVELKSGGRTTEFFVGSDRENSGTPDIEDMNLWMNSFSPSGNLSLNFYF
ncbi:MAG: hypothetical protein KC454_06100 [Flavobacteriales bacterium]|nr:hypothetical protein [Flavobacteriales bacterium]